MKRHPWRIWTGALVGMVVAGVVSAQSEDDAFAEANRKLEEMVTEVVAFVGDVRFDEADVQSLIELWPEFNELSELVADDDDDEMVDFNAVVADPNYRRWAAKHGLDPEEWMRKSTRISMALFREQILQSAAMAPQQIEQQMQMIEQQRDQLGEETYQQMKQAMESSAAYSKSMMETAKGLPEATPSEQAALDDHRDQLMMIMASDEDEGEYDDGSEYEEEYYDEEYDDEDY